MPAKKKTTRTKSVAKSSRKKKSNGLLKQSPVFNWKIVVPVLLIFALIGGYLIYSASASTVAFNYNANQLSGGRLVSKGAGNSYRLAESNRNELIVSPPISRWTFSTVRIVCMEVNGTKSHVHNQGTSRFEWGQQAPGGAWRSPTETSLNQRRTHCIAPTATDSRIRAVPLPGNEIAVYRIYGVR